MRKILLGLTLGTALAIAACSAPGPESSPLPTGTPDLFPASPSPSPDLMTPGVDESPTMELESPTAS